MESRVWGARGAEAEVHVVAIAGDCFGGMRNLGVLCVDVARVLNRGRFVAHRIEVELLSTLYLIFRFRDIIEGGIDVL